MKNSSKKYYKLEYSPVNLFNLEKDETKNSLSRQGS